MSRYCRVDMCDVPEPHKHRPPNAFEVAEARTAITLGHLPTCAWRLDIHDGCSCGVTGLVTELYTLGAVLPVAATLPELDAGE